MSRLRIVPLDDAVIFPGLTVTLPLDDAGSDARVLLVPRQGQGFARVGVVAEVSNRVRLSDHGAALSLLGLHRADCSNGSSISTWNTALTAAAP
jgi:ATP-dependent Lon protease